MLATLRVLRATRAHPVLRQVRCNSSVKVLDKVYPRDSHTNVTDSILSYVSRNIYTIRNHPLAILYELIYTHLGSFCIIPPVSPVVTPAQNFDSLSFPADHPGRQRSDSYYINKEWMLRTHTSAHEVETFARGEKSWLLTADVYRRDEIDASHHPVFHQMEGAQIFSATQHEMSALATENARLAHELARQDIVIDDLTTLGEANPVQPHHNEKFSQLVAAHLKHTLNGLILKLFKGEDGEPLRIRWIDAQFPFTSPSYEVEVFFRGKWLEILGCGVVLESTLEKAGVRNEIGWAFGLGLERIAMILFQVPDIRLFWTQDPRFLAQFKPGQIKTFKPYSKYPPLIQDISFWLPQPNDKTSSFIENDFCDTMRDVAGNLAEDVKLIDIFEHPKTKRRSHCYRINYRSMDRSLTHREVENLNEQVKQQLTARFGVEIR